MYSKYLKNQPKSHANEELEEKSFDVLQTTLPKNKFKFRDERAKDNGVDGSLEVKLNGRIVNFRAQFQLKAKSSRKIYEDGSASCPVEASNLNHLLNNPVSLYFLYIEAKNEIRFVWAKEEQKRLNETNPTWQSQGKVTLKFFKILNDETINEIHALIVKEGSFHRKINEVHSENKNKNIKVEFDSLTLEVIDGTQARKLLKSYGIELINSNNESFISEKFNLLSEEDKQDTDLLLLKSMAENNLGKYRTALDTLGTILLSERKLTEKQEFLFSFLENNCNWHLGKVVFEEFLNNSRSLARSKFVSEWNVTKFYLQRTDLTGGKDLDIRKEKLKTLQNLVKEIIADNSLSEETKIGVEILLLEAESSQLKLDVVTLLSGIPIFLQTGVALTDGAFSAKDFQERNNEWYKKANQLLQRTKNPIKQSEIIEESISLLLNIRNTEKYWMSSVGIPIQESNEFDSRIEQLKVVIEIYSKYKQTYLASKAKILLADIYYFLERFDESEQLRTQTNELSKKMAHSNLVWTSENLIRKDCRSYQRKRKTTKLKRDIIGA